MLRPIRKVTSDVCMLLAVGGLTTCLMLGSATVARADGGDDNPAPAPRTAITIGGASVVLIAADDKLYAFVDRLDNNAPVEDADLKVATADGGAVKMTNAAIPMNKATGGMFVGPLERKGHMQDTFMVTLHSTVANGQAPAEITYTDAISNAPSGSNEGRTSQLALVLVSGAIGAVGAGMLMLWLRGGRKRLGPVGGSAPAV